MVVNVSRLCRKCLRDRVRVYLDDTSDIFSTTWKLSFYIADFVSAWLKRITYNNELCFKTQKTAKNLKEEAKNLLK